MVSEDVIYQNSSNWAMHYNIKIWTVFSVGVALSLFILYTFWANDSLEDSVKIAMLIFGYLVLIYCSLAIESFGQKKERYNQSANRFVNNEERALIDNLPSKGILKYWEILILSFIFFSYLFSFISFSKYHPFLIGVFTTLMFIGYFFVAYNWARGYIEVRD